MMVPPGRSQPRCSASWIMARPTRSLTLPPGLSDSALTQTVAGTSAAKRRRRISGVQPIDCRMVSCIGFPFPLVGVVSLRVCILATIDWIGQEEYERKVDWINCSCCATVSEVEGCAGGGGELFWKNG